jgi:hypothetical protein
VVAARLAQRFVELAQSAHARFVVARIRQGEDPAPEGSRLGLGGLRVNITTGEVRVSPRLLVKSLAEYVGWSIYGTLAVCFRRRTRSDTPAQPAALVFGIGAEALFRDGSDADFAEYCARGPITPLAAARKLVVQALAAQRSSVPERIAYHRLPLYTLARTSPATLGEKVGFTCRQVADAVRFLALVLRHPLAAVLAQDLAQERVAAFLDQRAAIGDVVITNSNFGKQPLWMRRERRRYTVHMVWYSQNIIPFVYARRPVAADFPAYRHMAVDVAWVWTSAFAAYLEGLGARADYRVVGPVLWQLPGAIAAQREGDGIRIAVFDVVPVREEVARGLGLLNYYYNAASMIEFLDGISAAAREVERASDRRVTLLLKHKRAHAPMHDTGYHAAVDALRARGEIELLPPETNIHTLLAESDCAVVAPYSSPAYIASDMGKPSVFFDASGVLAPTYLPGPAIHFAGSVQALVAVILESLER